MQISSIYVDLPTDMTVYPQEYTLHCVKTGHPDYNFEMRLSGSTVTSASECTNTLSSCSGRVLLQDYSKTYDHTVTISWDGQTITSGSSFSQSNTGDQTFQCNMWVNNQPHRLHDVIMQGGSSIIAFIRHRPFVVPSFAPTSISVNKTATTITVNWNALDSSDTDGYVVTVTSDTDTVQTVQVEGSSDNIITLNGLRGGTTYNITVRAYQQLLGTASPISVQTLPGIAIALVNVLVTLLI